MDRTEQPIEAAQPDEALVSIDQILKQASAAVEDDPLTARACITRAAMMLREVQAKHAPGASAPDAPKGPGLASWQLNRVKLYIDTHLETSFKIRDLARLSGLSPGHFARAFRQSVGVSPRNFLLERRVERAKKLMLTTKAPLSEIALACGLSDQAHLSRIFRRYTGITPNAWRREWLEIEMIRPRDRAACGRCRA